MPDESAPNRRALAEGCTVVVSNESKRFVAVFSPDHCRAHWIFAWSDVVNLLNSSIGEYDVFVSSMRECWGISVSLKLPTFFIVLDHRLSLLWNEHPKLTINYLSLEKSTTGTNRNDSLISTIGKKSRNPKKQGRKKKPNGVAKAEEPKCDHGCAAVSAEQQGFCEQVLRNEVDFGGLTIDDLVMINEELIQALYCLTTNAVLASHHETKDWVAARRFTGAALSLTSSIKLFHIRVRSLKSGPNMEAKIQKTRAKYCFRKHTIAFCKRQTVDYLDRRMSCNCLADLKTQIG